MPSAVLWCLMFVPAGAGLAISWHFRAPRAERLAPEQITSNSSRDLTGRFRDLWLLVLLPIIQLTASSELMSSLSEGFRFRLCNSLTLAILAIFLVRNWPGMPRSIRSPSCIFVVGVVLNSIPRIVLGSMPYSASTARFGGIEEASLQVHQAGHVALTADTNYWLPLSDFIPLPGLSSVVSIGDLVMLVGLAMIIWRVLQWGALRRIHPQRDGPVEACDKKGDKNDEIRTRS